MEIFQLVWLVEWRIIDPVVKSGINANFLWTHQRSESIQERLPMLPPCEWTAISFFEIKEKRQFTPIIIQMVEPQFGLLSGVRAAIIEPVGTPRQASFFCSAPVIIKIRINP